MDDLDTHIEGCDGTCFPGAFLGNGICDPVLQCPELGWDDGDCVMCESDESCGDGDACNGAEVCTGDFQCTDGEVPD
jgi:hypothetical protein